MKLNGGFQRRHQDFQWGICGVQRLFSFRFFGRGEIQNWFFTLLPSFFQIFALNEFDSAIPQPRYDNPGT